MTTAVAVTSHSHMLPPPDRHTPRAHVYEPPEEQQFEVALAQTQRLLEQHGHLIVVYPATLPKPFAHRLHAIRSVLETDRMALMPTALPPLGTGVLVRQLRQLSLCEFSPGVLGASVRLLAHYIYAGALLNSVAKLDHLPVTYTEHARSWNPKAQFAVLATPTPQLVRTDSGAKGVARAALTGPQFPTHLTYAPGQLASDWVTGLLAPQWRVGQVQEAYLPAESPRWWGTGKLVEFAAAIPDVAVLYRLVSSVRRDECHWCGLELIGDRCAFCAAPVPVGSSRKAAAARQAPHRSRSGSALTSRIAAGSGDSGAGGFAPGSGADGAGEGGDLPARGASGLGAFLKQRHAAAAARSEPQSTHAVVADPRGL